MTVKKLSTSLKAAYLTAAATVAAALIGAWQVTASTAGDKPSRAQVDQMIQTESPYVADRELLRTELTQLLQQQQRINSALSTVQQRQAADHAILETLLNRR